MTPHPLAPLAALALVVAPAALAEPGDHVRAGEVELTPEIDAGTEYVTNTFRAEAEEIPAANVRIAPGLLVSAAGDDHEFRGSGKWVLRTYYFVGQNDALAQSTQVGNLNRFDEFQLSLGADTFKRSVVGWRLSEDMAKRNYGADCEYCDIPFLSQYRNSLATGLRISPGAALQFTPAFRWTYDQYLIPAHEDTERTYNVDNAFGPELGVKWAFLPRTALVGNLGWTFNDWQNNTITAEGTSDTALLPNSNVVKGTAGIDGRFTEKVLLQATVGYGVGLFTQSAPAEVADIDATGTDGFLAQAQVRYLVTPTDRERPGTSLTAGYVRDFRTSFFTNYVQFDQGFVEGHGRFGIVEPTVRYELRHENYNGEVDRSDWVNRVAGDLRIGSDWAAFTAGAWWQQRASSTDTVEYDLLNVHALATFEY